MRNSSPPSSKRIADAFAAICWFHELRLRLGVKTLVDVPRAIEPFTEEKRAATSRRWGDYKSGKHKPSAWVVGLADKQVTGSKAIFTSPLWATLRLDKSIVEIARSLLGTTSREGDELLQWMLDHQRPSKSRLWLRKRCRAMVSLGSLEGLAVLTTCMRLTDNARTPYLTLTFYSYATDCLLILGGWLYQRGIAQELAEYYEKTLLPACYDGQECSIFCANYYLNSIRILNNAISGAQEKAGRDLTREEMIATMLKLL